MSSISNIFNDPLGLKKADIKMIYICPTCQSKSDIPKLEEKENFILNIKEDFELRLQCNKESCLRTGFIRCVIK